MSFYSGFFNSVNGDRLYDGSDLSKFLEGLVTNGCLPNDTGLKAIPNGAPIGTNPPSVIISPGKAYYNGMWFINDANYIYYFSGNYGATKHHLLYICFDVNEIARNVTFGHLTGFSAPALPANGAGKYYMGIARVADQGVQPVVGNITDIRTYAGVSGTGITSASIVDSAITEAKIASGAVTYSKIGNEAIQDYHIRQQELNINHIYPFHKIWTAATDGAQATVTSGSLTHVVAGGFPGLEFTPAFDCYLLVQANAVMTHNSTAAAAAGIAIVDNVNPGTSIRLHGGLSTKPASLATALISANAVGLIPLNYGVAYHLRLGVASNTAGTITLYGPRTYVHSIVLPR